MERRQSKGFSRCAWLALLVAGQTLAASAVALDGAWRLTYFPQPLNGVVRTLDAVPECATTVSATVPGCCEMELVREGVLPDPFVGFNAFAFRAYEGHQWLYRRTFACPKRAVGERAVLVFDGVDTLADVFLNGRKIGECANMLVSHEFDVTDAVKDGCANDVAVLIRPVGLASRDRVVGELGATMGGGGDHDAFRKAPYMYGWDIAPHLPVSGIWRGVRLEIRPADRLEDVAWLVTSLDAKRRCADVGVKFRVNAPFDRLYRASVRIALEDGDRLVREETFPLNSFHQRLRMNGLRKVRLWWPRGAGEPVLYKATVELLAADGSVLARDVRPFGIRTVKLEYDDRKMPERPGRFLFRINGEPIYVRGVNWVQLDAIPSRQAELLPKTLPLLAELNVNLVRVWGGGVYEPEAFFDWCDRNGVMVWQDFMTACAVPPQDPAFQRAMREEVLSVVRAFRNHASLVLWSGDNENDHARRTPWGPLLARDPNDNVISRRVIPDVLREYDLTRPYLPSSPYVSREAFAGRAEPSEEHLWGGPRGWWKTNYYTEAPCWFSSEGGAHGLPAVALIERYWGEAAKTPWTNPDASKWQDLRWTDHWLYRATNPYLDKSAKRLVERNHIALRQLSALFGDVPRHDLSLLVSQSQAAQAESVKFQIERFRSQKFTKKGGYVVWNLRDCWPTVSDAIVDYDGNRKKAFDAVGTAHQDLLVMVSEEHGLLAINDTLRDAKGNVEVREARDGKLVFEGPFEVGANGVAEITKLPWSGQGLFKITWTSDVGCGENRYLHGEPPFDWKEYSAWNR